MKNNKIEIHSSAIVESPVTIGDGSKIWHFAHVRKGASLGYGCVVGKGVYIDAGVTVGNYVKIQNHVSIFCGVTIEDGVFIGPHACFTNDLFPRAVNPDMSPKQLTDWQVEKTTVRCGASLGANSTIVAGHEIGAWALVGAGAVVTRDVPPFALVVGNPGRVVGVVSASGEILSRSYSAGSYKSSTSGGVVEILPEWVR